MKKKISKAPLPLRWVDICPEALDLYNVRFSGCGIITKVLVFKNKSQANKFLWRRFKYRMPSRCRGLFWNLGFDWIDIKDGNETRYREVDKNFIGFIVLLANHLSLEAVVHECCHAAFAYDRRVPKNWPGSKENKEEHICYPVGKLTAQVCSALQKSGYVISGNHGAVH